MTNNLSQKKNQIITQLFEIFKKNDLSIRQAREVMNDASDRLEDFFPWHQGEKSELYTENALKMLLERPLEVRNEQPKARA